MPFNIYQFNLRFKKATICSARLRFRNVKALRITTTHFAQRLQLFGSVSTPSATTFSFQAARHRNNRVYDFVVTRARLHLRDERTVNFNGVEWKAMQVRKRRITGSKIVHRKTHAQFLN